MTVKQQYTAYTLSRELFPRSNLQTKARIANPLADLHEPFQGQTPSVRHPSANRRRRSVV